MDLVNPDYYTYVLDDTMEKMRKNVMKEEVIVEKIDSIFPKFSTLGFILG